MADLFNRLLIASRVKHADEASPCSRPDRLGASRGAAANAMRDEVLRAWVNRGRSGSGSSMGRDPSGTVQGPRGRRPPPVPDRASPSTRGSRCAARCSTGGPAIDVHDPPVPEAALDEFIVVERLGILLVPRQNPGIIRIPGGGGGGWGIRTPEGLHPTRFPSVRHRPLGESSRRSTRRQPRATRKEYIGPPIPGASPGRWDLSRGAGLAASAQRGRTAGLGDAPAGTVLEPYGASSTSGGGGGGGSQPGAGSGSLSLGPSCGVIQ